VQKNHLGTTVSNDFLLAILQFRETKQLGFGKAKTSEAK
jgi:hypothetical protein